MELAAHLTRYKTDQDNFSHNRYLLTSEFSVDASLPQAGLS